MPAKRWSVWSLAPDRTVWMEVAEDLDEAEAEASAASRMRYAERVGMPAQFLARPKGQPPGPDDILPVPEVLELADLVPTPGPDAEPIPVPGTPTRPGRWFDDYPQIVDFAAILVHAEALEDGQMAVVEYFWAPWNYDPEHIKWVEYERPQPEPEGNFGWRQFRKYIDAR